MARRKTIHERTWRPADTGWVQFWICECYAINDCTDGMSYLGCRNGPNRRAAIIKHRRLCPIPGAEQHVFKVRTQKRIAVAPVV